MNIRDINDINDVKKFLRIVFGAIACFQNNMSAIAGNINEIRSILYDVIGEVHNLSELLTEMKKMNDDEPNILESIIIEQQKYREEMSNI
ncbi:MAG: hypothetical protein ACFFG0_42180 [Candidatus Thorarchaeota archaeon]